MYWTLRADFHCRYFLADIMLNDEASKTLYVSFLQLLFDFVDVVWVEAHKGVAKSSEPKIHEGVLVFKCSDNLVLRCLSTLQQKGLCTILAVEERKTWANQSLNAILAK